MSAPEIIRTPEDRFLHLPGFEYTPNYFQHYQARVHFLKEGKGRPILCLHGEPSWSFLYRKMIPELSKIGTVYAPDFIGFGKSDKFTKIKDYSFSMHYNMLDDLVKSQGLKDIILVVQDWGGLIGLSYAADHPELFSGLVIMNTGLPTGMKKGKLFRQLKRALPFLIWQNYARFVPKLRVSKIVASGCALWVTDDIKAAYDAPFPDESFKAGARAFPLLVPAISEKHPSAVFTKRAKEKLSQWQKPVLIMFSDKDPITRGQHKMLEGLIPSADPSATIIVKDAGHFLQEDKGKELATHISEWLKKTGA